uniref:CH033 protein n=1 Tax=Chelonoidis abingdonii TaxID=106734 RepID=A0A8C0GWR1_CHEAB
MPEVVGCVGGGLGREALILEIPKPEIAAEDEVKTEKTAAVGAPKKKKKKKKKSSSSKKEMAEAEQSDKQLWREVDWCVEQLELGLKTHKSTPKQAEEALRAVKTLRSDKAVLAKKCQVMRAIFGDYKKKMDEERQKQLKLMQAGMRAAKSAQVMEVRENARRKSSQVFRKCSAASRKSPSSAGSPSHLPSHPESPQASGTNSFMFPTSQEEFCFNFF